MEVQTEMHTSDGGDKESSETSTATSIPPNPRKDIHNIVFLLILYCLQGIPLGLAASVPLILTGRGASMSMQATFSLVSWPYSLKFLWAPIVDSLYSDTFGRRKTWIIPAQFTIGIALVYVGTSVENLIEADAIYSLTGVFFALYFLAATQDIAVDAWALTLLADENVGYASTCNAVGMTVGFFVSYSIFLALNSEEFANSYIRSEARHGGLVGLPQFMSFWGYCYIVVTTLILVFKKELSAKQQAKDVPAVAGMADAASKTAEATAKPHSPSTGQHMKASVILEDTPLLLDTVDAEDGESPPHNDLEVPGVAMAYKQMWMVIKLPAVLMLAAVLLTDRIGSENATTFRLLSAGMPKEHLGLFAVAIVPVDVLFTTYIGKYISGPDCLKVYFYAYPAKLVLTLLYVLLVAIAPPMGPGVSTPVWFYASFIGAFVLHSMSRIVMFSAKIAFFAKCSRLNSHIGATYMTLLNTVSNLGSTWVSYPVLKMIDWVSVKECQGAASVLSCDTDALLHVCKEAGGTCKTVYDGYYPVCLASFAFGLIWSVYLLRLVRKVDAVPAAGWKAQLVEREVEVKEQ